MTEKIFKTATYGNNQLKLIIEKNSLIPKTVDVKAKVDPKTGEVKFFIDPKDLSKITK
ncbi:MAG: hypothetical protein ABF991_12940 [Liquorilactobacillus hordei]|uniref:hypothetical protein n=1 Tax=Liquorilactobacillus hordei TaxID=468911 RepID=UPI0015E8135A|nr:hypothetical protein [Liquorilactobacillus hordei]MBZ2406509.1 hypothetical protein [Liquorilactobacillus hordei]